MAKTVYLGMIGDIMHPGYINIINKATEYGDVIIGLFTDKAIANHRRLPYLTWEQRKNVVESIRNVSRVVPQDDWSYVSNLLKYKPDYIIHGDDWQVGPDKYIRDEVFKVMEKLGGEVIEIPYTQNISASGIKQEIDALGVTPQMRLSSLRRLIAAKPIVRILESHNGLTGLIAEHTKVEVNGQEREFDGMWASSLTDSTSKGKPDIEAVDLTTRLHDLNDTLEVTTKPAYVEAGTDGIMIHSKEKSGEDIKEFCLRFREKNAHTPIIVVPTTYNQFTEEELAEWGINVVIYANHMLRSAYPAMVKCAETILYTSRSLEASEQYCMPIKQILNLIPGTKKK